MLICKRIGSKWRDNPLTLTRQGHQKDAVKKYKINKVSEAFYNDVVYSSRDKILFCF